MAPRKRGAASAAAVAAPADSAGDIPAAAGSAAATTAPPATAAAEPPPDYDVAIVGLGPVGAFAANVLLNYGMRVLVLERDTAPYAAPRAVAMDDEAVRLFGLIEPGFPDWLQRHLYEAPIDLRTGPPPEAAACLRPLGEDAAAGAGGGAAAAGFTPGWSMVGPLPPRRIAESGGGAEFAFVHQPTVERKLRARLAAPAAAARVDVRLGVEVLAVAQAPGGRTVLVSSHELATGRVASARARYVLGCDGGSSGVRKSLGIAFAGASFKDEPWLVIDCESDDAALAAAYPHFNFMNAWDASVGAFRCVVHVPLPGPRAARRFEFLLERGESAEEMTRPAALARLLTSVGVHPSRVHVVRCLVYTFHARQAASWREGRVLLLGDAAHCMPPFRGQGMCAGLRDAANLCWKVATAVALDRAAAGGDSGGAGGGGGGGAGDALLATYRPERWPHLQATTDIAIGIGSLVQLRRPLWLRAARNLVMGALYRCPATRPFFMEPFAPPTSLGAGWLDFHGAPGGGGGGAGGDASGGGGRCGGWVCSDAAVAAAAAAAGGGRVALPAPPTLLRALCGGMLDALPLLVGARWGGASGAAAGLRPGWAARDAAAGRPVPNFAVELVHDGSAARIPLDALLQPAAVATGGSERGSSGAAAIGGLGAPVWTLLVSPRFAGPQQPASAGGSGSAQPHPLETLRQVLESVPQQAQQQPLLIAGVQLLPVTAALSRIAQLRAHQLAAQAQVAAGPAAAAPGGKPRRGAAAATAATVPAVTVTAGGATAPAPALAAYRAAAHAHFDAVHGTGVPHSHGGPIFTLGDGSGTAVESAAAAAAAVALKGAASAASPPPWEALADAAAADSSGRLGCWFDAHAGHAALVRPDRVVYGLYDAAELRGALRALLACVGETPPAGVGGAREVEGVAVGGSPAGTQLVLLRHRSTLPLRAARWAGVVLVWLLLLAAVVFAVGRAPVGWGQVAGVA